MADTDLFAFVLMPFNAEYNDVYKFGIKEAATSLGIRAERVDEQKFTEGMLERIYRQIDYADIIIADMSGQNPNVFYEVGYAHAKNKICILLTKDANDIPFDLKHRRHIIYKSISELKGSLEEELVWAKQEVRNIKEAHININVKSITATLESTKYWRDAIIDFRVDLKNGSDKPSPEIENAFIYTGKRIDIFQNEKECPSNTSDLEPYLKQHFLNFPVRRLLKGQWARLEFRAKRRLASAFSGDELKDEYKIEGHTTLRLITAEGNFDYKFNVNVDVNDEIPF